MKELISDTTSYEIGVDTDLNCVYYKWKGFWRNEKMASEFLQSIEELILKLRPKFSLIVDNRDLITSPNIVLEKLIMPALLMLHNAGLTRSAIVMPEDEIAILNTKRVSEQSSQINSAVQRSFFKNIEDAENWIKSF